MMILTSKWRAEHPFAGRNTQQVHIFLFSSSTMKTNKKVQESLAETTPWKVKRCKSPVLFVLQPEQFPFFEYAHGKDFLDT